MRHECMTDVRGAERADAFLLRGRSSANHAWSEIDEVRLALNDDRC
jgi:hypothetical protein